jgi:hypothetical protein
MALALYLAFLGVACTYALVDWRRAFFIVIVCGVIQDPVRKLTPNTPVIVSFLVVGLYAVIVFAARRSLVAYLSEFGRRFPRVNTALFVVFLMLVVAALNGLATYGLSNWKVPAISLFTYCIPLIAALFGYAWLQREEAMMTFFRFYAIVTSLALGGTLLEYARVTSPILGMVGAEGDWIRHLPGIQIRLLSGLYRGPDIMAWHAATLTAIGVAMAVRSGVRRALILWGGVAAWGFFNCMISGRRKAIYYVIVFAAVLMWRYFRRVRVAQVLALLAVLGILGTVVRQFTRSEETSVYARGALATQQELTERLEGGALETLQQFGYMGAGLGTATQGVYHLTGGSSVGWQEGGLGKLMVEVGVPGVIALAALGYVVLRLLLRLTAASDVRGSSQFLRATLFGLVAANGAGFLASAQAYTDAILGLTTGFFVGCLFASAALDERLAGAERTSRPEAVGSAQPAPVLS